MDGPRDRHIPCVEIRLSWRDRPHPQRALSNTSCIHHSAFSARRARAHAFSMVLYEMRFGCKPVRTMECHHRVAVSRSPARAQASITELKMAIVGSTPLCSMRSVHHIAPPRWLIFAHDRINEWKTLRLHLPLAVNSERHCPADSKSEAAKRCRMASISEASRELCPCCLAPADFRITPFRTKRGRPNTQAAVHLDPA